MPTAPEILPTATTSRTDSRRSEGAGEFVVHQRELEAEGRGLAVDAVAAAHARRELVFLRAPGDDGQHRFTSAMRMSALCIICTA